MKQNLGFVLYCAVFSLLCTSGRTVGALALAISIVSFSELARVPIELRQIPSFCGLMSSECVLQVMQLRYLMLKSKDLTSVGSLGGGLRVVVSFQWTGE
jgi:hypothetical protein